jgi:putative endonuclease
MLAYHRFVRRCWYRITKPLRRRTPWVTCPELPLGKRGELYAAEYLREMGYLLIDEGARNRYGEIDLIAIDERTVVFVEVKSRADPIENALAAVHQEKQKRISRAALAYLKRHRLLNHAARMDVIGIVWPDGASVPTLTHVRNAFEPPGKGQMFA